jgi:hypothetical protein
MVRCDRRDDSLGGQIGHSSLISLWRDHISACLALKSMSNTKLLAITMGWRSQDISHSGEGKRLDILSREYGTVDRRWHNRDPLTCRLASSPAEIALYFGKD